MFIHIREGLTIECSKLNSIDRIFNILWTFLYKHTSYTSNVSYGTRHCNKINI